MPNMQTCAICGYLAVGSWQEGGLFVCTACSAAGHASRSDEDTILSTWSRAAVARVLSEEWATVMLDSDHVYADDWMERRAMCVREGQIKSLRSLAQRFGLDAEEVREEACQRAEQKAAERQG